MGLLPTPSLFYTMDKNQSPEIFKIFEVQPSRLTKTPRFPLGLCELIAAQESSKMVRRTALLGAEKKTAQALGRPKS